MSSLWNPEIYESLMENEGQLSDLTAARMVYARGGVTEEGRNQAIVRWLKREIGEYAREKREDGLPRFPTSADCDEDGKPYRKQLSILTEADVRHNIEQYIARAKANAAEAMPFVVLYEERWGTCSLRPEVERILDCEYGDGDGDGDAAPWQ